MSRRYDSTLARMAGNIAAGMLQGRPLTDGYVQMVAEQAVKCARMILSEIEEKPEGVEAVGALSASVFVETPDNCACGHSRMMHPFGHSEHLMMTGGCMLCSCGSFTEQGQ